MEISLEESTDVNPASGAFSVHLENFDGPFDLLLQLISRHKMDVTAVALSAVTDEFISFIRDLESSGKGWELDQATEFLVVAATLLDLKAARLLPSGDVEDEEDLALLERGWGSAVCRDRRASTDTQNHPRCCPRASPLGDGKCRRRVKERGSSPASGENGKF